MIRHHKNMASKQSAYNCSTYYRLAVVLKHDFSDGIWLLFLAVFYAMDFSLRNCPEKKKNSTNQIRQNVCQVNWICERWYIFLLLQYLTRTLAVLFLRHDVRQSLPYLVFGTFCAFEMAEKKPFLLNTFNFSCSTTLFWLNCAYLFA